MTYGRMAGDYYAGDYYAGDPGLKDIFRRAVGFIPGVGPGLAALFGGGGGTTMRPAAMAPSNIGIMAPGGGVINASAQGTNPGNIGSSLKRWMEQHPYLSAGAALLGGAALTTTADLIKLGGQPMPGGAVMAGRYGGRRMHPNKSTYVVRGGGTSRYPVGLNVVLKGTSLVPTRRMNVANPRALRRSLRRVAGFAKLTKRVRHAVSLCASAVGVHRRGARRAIRRR